MYLEAVAIFPQIYMFQKQAAEEGGTVEVFFFFLIFNYFVCKSIIFKFKLFYFF
jgi:hypothetical protein